ncbi:MAG TPA: AMP-binding protein [Caulobacteraceae bacterium]|jgi:2-aminobenzoate-CoA ligase
MTATAHVDTFVRDNLPPPEQQPEFRFDLPELRYPERLNAGDLLDRAVSRGFADRTAVQWKDGRWTYAELLAHANGVAGVLAADPDFVAGARVLLHGGNRPWAIAAWFGVVKAGGVVVATMPLLRAPEIATVAAKARVTHAIVEAPLYDTVRVAANMTRRGRRMWCFGDGELEQLAGAHGGAFSNVQTAADDPALIAFTSGTTGKPKGCVHYHRDVFAMADTFSRSVLRPGPDEVFCGTPPFAFTFGLGGLVVFPLAAGASVALCERPGFEELCATVERHRATTLFTAPTGYRALLKLREQYDLSSLTNCVSAGETLPAATSDAWFDATGLRIIDGIGATEMIHIFISASGEDIRPGATGKPVPGYTAALLDEDDREIEGEAQGRLAIKGPTGCRYLADPRQQTYVRRGWNVTGDVYRRDAEGYYWFVSRADDMIVSAGYNIAAAEVEAALLRHPAVAETAVIGVPDAERGQIVKAFVVLADPATAGDDLRCELQNFVKGEIAPYKYPRALEFVSELPKTQTGKLQRFRLREEA